MQLQVFALVAAVGLASAVLEERWVPFVQPGWYNSNVKPGPDTPMVTIMALKQRNEQFLEEAAQHITDPLDIHYGEYLTRDVVAMRSRPERGDIEAVHGFLGSFNGTVRWSRDQGLVKLTCTVACMERTFGTELGVMEGTSQPGTSPLRAVKPIVLPNTVASALDGVSLNAPVFMPRRPKRPKGKPFRYPSCGRSSPRLDPHIVSGDSFVGVKFVAYCRDGSPNSNRVEQGLCSSSPGSPTIVSFEVLILQQPNMQHVAVLPAVGNLMGQNTGDCGPGVQCIQFNVTIGVQNYANTTASIRALYSDGSASPFSNPDEVNATWPLPYVTPHVLSKHYGMEPNKPVSHPRNTISVAEFLGQYYNPKDLDAFFHLMGVQSWGSQAQPQIQGPDLPGVGSVLGDEAQLDIQYIMAMAANVTTVFWSVPGVELATRQEPFLEWLMEVGDADDSKAPLVHSVSYGDDETEMPTWFKRRVNFEFMKLALRGISILVASGDDGASGIGARFGDERFCKRANPEFPASSPWVTAVGGTQLAKGASPVCGYNTADIVVMCPDEGEVGCSSETGGGITTGGGFSTDFNRPWYQRSAVDGYLNQKDSPLPGSDWNYSSTKRGFPDIAAIASHYLVWMGDHLEDVSGTSASTPLVAAMVAHWNELRLQAGLPALGFLNPLLYRLAANHPEAFNDVVVGNNRCAAGAFCCKTGFGAARGWDAISGIGSPKFDSLQRFLDPSTAESIRVASRLPGLTKLVQAAPHVSLASSPANVAASWVSLALPAFAAAVLGAAGATLLLSRAVRHSASSGGRGLRAQLLP